MITSVLLLGGNVGDVASTFRGVVSDLECEVGAIVKSSDLFRSAAWGFEADDFLNQAVMVSTDLAPEALLDAIQGMEAKWGREREKETQSKIDSGARYMSRTIDIDIIFYGDVVMSSDRLTLPHPLVAERKFVLEPIAQIAPGLVSPKSGKSVEQMLNELIAVK